MRFLLPATAVLLGSLPLILVACSGTDASINDDVGDDGGGSGGTGDGGGSRADGGFDATTGDATTGGRDATTGDGSSGGGDASGSDGATDGAFGNEAGALDAGDAGDAADAGPSPDDVPLTVRYLGANGADDIGFEVTVSIGGTSIPALLDTGSSGIRVVQGAVPAGSFASVSTTNVSVTYGSGTVASGVVATASVTFGNLTTAAPIPVQLITDVGCTEQMPNCPAKNESLDDFAFKGESGGTWKVIVGVGMRVDGDGNQIGNPIVQLPGSPAYVVNVSGPYTTTTGNLRIGPTPAEKATFKTNTMVALVGGGTLGNGVTAYNDRGNPVCIVDGTAPMTYCADALLDTGTAATIVDWAKANRSFALPEGDAVTVNLDDQQMPPNVLGSYSFTVQQDPKAGLDLVDIDKTESVTSSINTGTAFFFHQQVYEDQTSGTIGVAPF
jgi:hypothetical protein